MKSLLTLLLLALALPFLATAQNTSPPSSDKTVAMVLQHLKGALKPGVKADVFQKLQKEAWFKENCEVTVLQGFAGALDFELLLEGTLAYVDVIPGEGSLIVFFQIAGNVDQQELRTGSSQLKSLVITDVSFPSE